MKLEILKNTLFQHKPTTNYKKQLVTTSKGAYLFYRKKIYKLSLEYCYGVTKILPNTYMIFERGKLEDKNQRFLFLFIFRKLVFSINIKTPIDSGCHQILWHKNKLYVCNTYLNAINVLTVSDILFAKQGQIYYPFGKLNNGRDSDNYKHINSITPTDDGFALMLHNETSKSGRSSEIAFVNTKFKLIRTLSINSANAHNIVFEHGKTFTLDSGNGKLNCGSHHLLKSKYFLRGLAIDGEDFYIGCSQIASRKQRDSTGGGIIKFNSRTKIVEFLPLPFNILDIHLIT